MSQVTSSRSRRSALMQGGRIFAVLAGAGGLLTCSGASFTWARVYPSTSDFDNAVLVRPITGANPAIPLIALAAGLAIVALAAAFIAARPTKRRTVLALALIGLGIVTGLAFTDLRIGGASTLVPSELQRDLPICEVETPRPCLYVYWPTEMIVWGGWIAAFWGACALIRVRPRQTRAPIAKAREAAVDRVPSLSDAPEPATGWRGTALRAEPPTVARPRRSRGPRSDFNVLGWLVGIVAGGAVLFVTGFMILFAMFYGDPAEPEITDRREGPALFLSPDAPSAAAGITFEANAAAMEVSGLELLVFEWDTFWSGVPAGATELTPEIVKMGGPPLGEEGFRESDPQELVCYGEECIGTYQARFRWPSGLEDGSVRIEWRVTANISYQSDPSDGAAVRAKVERAAGVEPPARVFDGSFLLGATHPYVAKTTLTIRSDVPIPLEGELAVEVDPDPSGASPVVMTLVQEQGALLPLQLSTSTRLAVPGRCRAGPCTFEVSLIAALPTRRTLPPANPTWGVTSKGLAGLIAVIPTEQTVPRVTERVALGPVRLEGVQVASFAVMIRLPPEALPAAEFEVAEPVIQALVSFDAQADAIEFPDDAELELEVSFPSASGAAEPFSTVRWDGNLDYPESFVVPNRCLPGIECEVEILIRFTGSDRDPPFEGVIDVFPTLEVAVGYPLAGVAPASARLDIAEISL